MQEVKLRWTTEQDIRENKNLYSYNVSSVAYNHIFSISKTGSKAGFAINNTRDE